MNRFERIMNLRLIDQSSIEHDSCWMLTHFRITKQVCSKVCRQPTTIIYHHHQDSIGNEKFSIVFGIIFNEIRVENYQKS